MTVVDDRVAVVIDGVPYRSQWVSPECVGPILRGEMAPSDDPRWRESGAETPDEYDFWSGRVCGITCLRMVLEHRGIAHGTTMDLVRLAEYHGAYVRRDGGVRGLVYEPFARMTRECFGLEVSVRPALALDELRGTVDAGELVIASVHPSIREPRREAGGRGGHLVLCLGIAGDDVVLHNPSGDRPDNQERARVRTADLARFYAGRGMVVASSPAGS